MADADISWSDVRDIMLQAVETGFEGHRAPHPVGMLGDNGAPCTAQDTRIFARQLGLTPCFTQLRSPRSNSVSEAFVKIVTRNDVRSRRCPMLPPSSN